jgi:hypothetical protein
METFTPPQDPPAPAPPIRDTLPDSVVDPPQTLLGAGDPTVARSQSICSPQRPTPKQSKARSPLTTRYPQLLFEYPQVRPTVPPPPDPGLEVLGEPLDLGEISTCPALSPTPHEAITDTQLTSPTVDTELPAAAPICPQPRFPPSPATGLPASQPFPAVVDDIFTRAIRSTMSTGFSATQPPPTRPQPNPEPAQQNSAVDSDSHLALLQLLLGPRSPLPQDGVLDPVGERLARFHQRPQHGFFNRQGIGDGLYCLDSPPQDTLTPSDEPLPESLSEDDTSDDAP